MYHFIASLAICLVWVALAGLVRRRRLFEWLSFSTYLLAVGGFGLFIMGWPDLYTPELWLVKQGIYDSLMFLMSLELAYRVFADYRGIARRVRLLTASAVFGSSLLVGAAISRAASYGEIWRYQPSLTVAGIWCLTALSLAIVHFQIPVSGWVSAVLLALVPYMLVFTIAIDLIGRLGWGAIDGIGLANAVAYLAASAYWARAAWRPN